MEARKKLHKKIRIYAVDDHPIIKIGLKSFLSSQGGYEIVGFSDSALPAIKEIVKLKPDLIIMDISMPDLDGIEATRRILKELPDSKVLIFSMHIDNHLVVEALKAGAKGFVLKSSDTDELIDAIENITCGSRYLSPALTNKLLDGYIIKHNRDDLESLTEREKDVLRYVAAGLSSKEIGLKLAKSEASIKKYRTTIMKKLNVEDMAGLIRFAMAKGILKTNHHKTN